MHNTIGGEYERAAMTERVMTVHFNRIVPRCVAESVSNYPARGHSHGQITWVGYQMGRG
jgi:hypothetical protein